MGIFMAGLAVIDSVVCKTGKCVTQKQGCCAIIVFCVVLLSGCKSESIVTPESQLLVTPSSTSFDIVETQDSLGNCIFSVDYYQDVPVNVTLTDSLNRSLGRALVTVYVDYTGNTFSGPETLQLFSDNNGNRVIDTVDELVSGAGDEAFTLHTDAASGTINLLLRVNLSCAYRGRLYAFAGPIAGTSSISVNNLSDTQDDRLDVEQQPQQLIDLSDDETDEDIDDISDEVTDDIFDRPDESLEAVDE